MQLHGPAVLQRCRQTDVPEDPDRFVIHREHLPNRRAGSLGRTTESGYRVRRTICPPLVMPEAQSVASAGEAPGARMIVTDMQGHMDIPRRRIAIAHMQHRLHAFKRITHAGRRFVGRHLSRKCLAAMAGQRGHELIDRGIAVFHLRRTCADGQAAGEGERLQCQQEGFLVHAGDRSRCLPH
ncbi:hypothetical protein D3C81_1322470 [compost metagenome]